MGKVCGNILFEIKAKHALLTAAIDKVIEDKCDDEGCMQGLLNLLHRANQALEAIDSVDSDQVIRNALKLSTLSKGTT